jgi:hypothetical protein
MAGRAWPDRTHRAQHPASGQRQPAVSRRPQSLTLRALCRNVGDAGGGQGGADGGQHGGQLLEVVGLLGQLSSHYDLGGRGGRLGVVALQVRPLPRTNRLSGSVVLTVAVGLGASSRRRGRMWARGRWPRAGAAAASSATRCWQRCWRAAASASSWGPGVLQPGQPLSPAGQRSRQRLAPPSRSSTRSASAAWESSSATWAWRWAWVRLAAAAAFDLPGGADPGAVGRAQHGRQHLWRIGGPAVPVGSVGLEEWAKVELVDDVEGEPGQVTGWEPVAQVRWEQKGLVAVAGTEVVGHGRSYLRRFLITPAPAAAVLPFEAEE